MGVTGKRVEKLGIDDRARTMAGAGPTDLQTRHRTRCQATTDAGCRKPRQRAPHQNNNGTGGGAKQHATRRGAPTKRHPRRPRSRWNPWRSREAETWKGPGSSSEAGTRPRNAQKTRRLGLYHAGRTKQQEPPFSGLDHAGTTGGRAPRAGTSGAEQAGGAAAPRTGTSRGQVAVDAPDRNIRSGTSSRSRRSPDWNIERQRRGSGHPGMEHPGPKKLHEPPPRE